MLAAGSDGDIGAQVHGNPSVFHGQSSEWRLGGMIGLLTYAVIERYPIWRGQRIVSDIPVTISL
jgi:hypothetical protein